MSNLIPIIVPTNPNAEKVLELAARRKEVAAEATANLAEVERLDAELDALLMPPRRGEPTAASNGNGHANGNGRHAPQAAPSAPKHARPAGNGQAAKRAARAKQRHADRQLDLNLAPKTSRIVKALAALGGVSHPIADISKRARTPLPETTWRLRQAREHGAVRRFAHHRYGIARA